MKFFEMEKDRLRVFRKNIRQLRLSILILPPVYFIFYTLVAFSLNLDLKATGIFVLILTPVTTLIVVYLSILYLNKYKGVVEFLEINDDQLKIKFILHRKEFKVCFKDLSVVGMDIKKIDGGEYEVLRLIVNDMGAYILVKYFDSEIKKVFER